MTIRHIEALREVKNFNISPYTATPHENFQLLVIDPYPKSNYYFGIAVVDSTSDDIKYTISYRPHTTTSTDSRDIKISSVNCETHFKAWVDLIRLYDDHLEESVQESITKGYEEEYFAEFDLVDEDADTRSYSQGNQESIEAYLSKVADRLRQYKNEVNIPDEVVSEIDKLIDDIEQLILTQTRYTKRQVASKIINIVARCRKAAPKIIKEIGFEFVKSLLIDGAQNLLG